MAISKVVRISGYVLLFFILVFLTVGIWLNFFFNKKLIESIKEQVSESTNGEYGLSLKGLTINLITHTIAVNDLVISPLKKESHSNAQYLFQAKKLRIIDFSIFAYFRRSELVIDRVEFAEPEISIYQGFERFPQKKVDSTSNKFSLYHAFSKKLNSISIGQIEIVNSKLNIYKNGIDSLSVLSTNDNSISIKNFCVNAGTDKENKLFSAEKFEIVMNKFSYHLDNGLYTLNGKKLFASYLDSTLIIDSLQLIPNFSKKEFSEKADRQINRIEFISSKVFCRKMDVKLFFEFNWLVIYKVELSGCAFAVYRDNTFPLKPIIRPSVQAMLKDLPFFVAVDTVEMKNAEAVYEEINPEHLSMGKISINKINATITGIQNDSTSYSEKSTIKAIINGYVMNQGKFTETYTFPLNTRKEFFYCVGSCSSMPMTSFNPLIEPSKHISIKSGTLDYASFSFVAREQSSDGTMKFMYHDLKVEPLNKKDLRTKLKQKLKIVLVNIFVIDSNPGKRGLIRISNIHVEHNPYRYFSYYAMQSILSGIAPAIAGEKNIARMKKRKK